MFENVKIVKKANVYFDGKVTSRTVEFADGTRKTLGFMNAGEYKFNTAAEELMEVIGGEMSIKRVDDEDFITFKEGESFVVKENSSFDVKVTAYADYCCSYK